MRITSFSNARLAFCLEMDGRTSIDETWTRYRR